MCANQFIDLNECHPDYNVYRYEKFQLDISDRKINKICMTEIVNADMMIATFGEKSYSLGCKEVLTQGRNDIKSMGLSDCVIHYMYNYKNFIVAATEDMSDDDFGRLMYATYQQYMISSSKQTGLDALSRFVIVYGDDLIDRAHSAFYMHNTSQNNYIIASNEKELLSTANKEILDVFNLLNYAINTDSVIPYYQGIHNNELGKIDKYEALMRIRDDSGKIYSPFYFLDISKKFKLYHTISKIMIDKVLNDFDGNEADISINVSLYDVENDEFTNWFLNRIKKFHDPKKLTLEFVETENYNSGEKLYAFLNQVRKLGCKIAVDDFGVGFATYTSIISLKPDIIKIDGAIIKDLVHNGDHRMILESICFMALLIGAKTVAEFVENGEIQNILEQYSINYSQGYYFSKPQPLSEI